MQNGCVESFNGKMRDELLNETLFFSLDQARGAVAAWTEDYNTERPHSSLAYETPAALGDVHPRAGVEVVRCLIAVRGEELPDRLVAGAQARRSRQVDADIGGLIGLHRAVAGRGKIGDARGESHVHRLCDDPVHIDRLAGIADIVHDDVGDRGEVEDALREFGLAGEGGVECHRRARRHVVDQLRHGAALVDQRAVGAVVQDVDAGGQISARHVVGVAGGQTGADVERVRQDADRHAPAIGAEHGGEIIGLHCRGGLRGHRTGIGHDQMLVILPAGVSRQVRLVGRGKRVRELYGGSRFSFL